MACVTGNKLTDNPRGQLSNGLTMSRAMDGIAIVAGSERAEERWNEAWQVEALKGSMKTPGEVMRKMHWVGQCLE